MQGEETQGWASVPKPSALPLPGSRLSRNSATQKVTHSALIAPGDSVRAAKSTAHPVGAGGGGAAWKRYSDVRQTRGWVPGHLLISWACLSRLLSLSAPHFPHLPQERGPNRGIVGLIKSSQAPGMKQAFRKQRTARPNGRCLLSERPGPRGRWVLPPPRPALSRVAAPTLASPAPRGVA